MQNPAIKRSEFWSAMILLALHGVLFPILVPQLPFLSAFTPAQQNLIWYAVSAALTFLMLGAFLRRSFDSLLDRFFRCFMYFVLGYALYMGASLLLGEGLYEKLGLVNPNDALFRQMVQTEKNTVLAMTVFLAPVVEECIFRGGLFGGLESKSRFAAYAVSAVLFGLYHVWQFALAYWDARYLLIALQYLPAGLILCYVYDKSDSIWTPIALHMIVNLTAMRAM